MASERLISTYLHDERRPPAVARACRVLNVLLAFCMTFFGVPIPVPQDAPRPIRVALEALQMPDAEAVQIKTVQRGTYAFGTADESTEITIASVDTTKAVVFITNTSASTNSYPAEGLISADFVSDTKLYLYRQGSGTTATVEWQVVEFASNFFFHSQLS